MFFSSKSLTKLGIDSIRISPPFSRDLLKLGDALLVCMGILSLLLLLLQLGKCTVAFRHPRCLMIVFRWEYSVFITYHAKERLPLHLAAIHGLASERPIQPHIAHSSQVS
mgnify:FL=1